MKKLLGNKIVRATFFVVLGLAAGWFLFHNEAVPASVNEHAGHEMEEVWTCSMHPQIRRNEQGLCPICEMDLVPVNGEMSNTGTFTMTDEAAKLAEVRTMVVGQGALTGTIKLQGKVVVDERKLSKVTAQFPGRIDKLHVNYTGASVNEGDELATIYSPELINAKDELLDALQYQDTYPTKLRNIRETLRSWGFTDEEILEIEQTGNVSIEMIIRSPVSGVVLERSITLGDHVVRGTDLFRIAKLDRVWVLFDVYEQQLGTIGIGDTIHFNISGIDGQYSAPVLFVDRLIDPQTRVAKMRVELPNPGLRIKPEMFASGTVSTKVGYSEEDITVPKSAILWTGKRSVLYVMHPSDQGPMFELRTVELGKDLGEQQVIKNGVAHGERVVVNGAFKVDAAIQLSGGKSMMNHNGMGDPIGHQQVNKQNAAPTEGTVEAELYVYGKCSMCRKRIEKVALSIPGVISAQWSKDDKILRTRIDPKVVSNEKISKAVAGVGHRTELDEAPEEVYNDLPACCKYDE